MMRRDAVVIGAGPAGLAAAVSLKRHGAESVLVVEREEHPGGVLLQCIHNGFGVHLFGEELTGPEYAERYIRMAADARVEIQTDTAALDIIWGPKDRRVVLLSERHGLQEVDAGVVVLAMGCREKNRGNINIPGSRPAGIMTAGLAQRLVNLEGYLPGREIVVLGSGDIGLIMARRLTWEGARVKAVIELQPFPGGLTRNIVQCLMDFHIPLYLSHTITRIMGSRRIEAVEVGAVDTVEGGGRFVLGCDTLLLSVGLVPENELSLKAGVALDPVTGGAAVDADLMTSQPGIFSCGNVLHVHDLVDWVSEEAERCGERAALYLRGELPEGADVSLRAGNMVRYLLPSRIRSGEEAEVSLRAMAPLEDAVLLVKSGGDVLHRRRFRKVVPSGMIRLRVPALSRGVKGADVLFAPAKEAEESGEEAG
jgi:NADPH-dependent 2,4-dienoyl-CoA reductase/sulfur reductase-like enzyme